MFGEEPLDVNVDAAFRDLKRRASVAPFQLVASFTEVVVVQFASRTGSGLSRRPLDRG